jgi:hypothetical protein
VVLLDGRDIDIGLRVRAIDGSVGEDDISGGPEPLIATQSTDHVSAHGHTAAVAQGRAGIGRAGQKGGLVRDRRCDRHFTGTFLQKFLARGPAERPSL